MKDIIERLEEELSPHGPGISYGPRSVATISFKDAQQIVDALRERDAIEFHIRYIRSNFNLWAADDIRDGDFSFHLESNLRAIEKLLPTPPAQEEPKP